MSVLPLSKLHATGNDFLVLVDLDGRFGPAGSPTLAAPVRSALCDRRRGVGADGLIRLTAGGADTDCVMELSNADGGLAEISGNGLRCLAHAAARAGLLRDGRLRVGTAAGTRQVDVRLGPGEEVVSAEVDMGAVSFEPSSIPLDAPGAFDLEASIDGVAYRGDAAGCGNPHFVFIVADPAAVALERHGPLLEADARFPRRTNVEMIAPRNGGLVMRVWERGVGETASCGSGAVAAAAVAHRRGLVPARTTVDVPGGRLTVEIGDTARLGGPVVHVFDVQVDVERLSASRREPV
ncbi:MAG: diaminopimelate epimerase [Acidimicrobiia bacterium]